MTKIHSRTEYHVYAVGDSFTYGDELAEGEVRGVCIDDEYRLKHVYPTRVAYHLSVPLDNVINDGTGAGSNCRCVRRAMKFTSDWMDQGNDPTKLLVIIGWSMPRRTEFYQSPDREGLEGEEYYIKYYQNFYDKKDVSAKFMRLYGDHFVSAGESNARYSTHLVTMQSYLKEYGFPYFFFNSCWKARPDKTQNSSVFKLVDRDRFFRFDDRLGTLSNYLTFEKKLEMLPRGHPTEKGHDIWGKLIADKFLELDL